MSSVRASMMPPIIRAHASCNSSRVDVPFGTKLSINTVTPDSNTGTLIGVSAEPPPFSGRAGRSRLGVSYRLNPVYNSGVKFTLYWKPIVFNTTALYLPQAYMSSADNTALYTTTGSKAAWDWEDDLDVDLGTLTANDSALYKLDMDYADMSPFFGGVVSFVLGFNKDFDNSGARVNAQDTTHWPYILVE